MGLSWNQNQDMLNEKVAVGYRKASRGTDGVGRKCKTCRERVFVPDWNGWRCAPVGLKEPRKFEIEDDHICGNFGMADRTPVTAGGIQ